MSSTAAGVPADVKFDIGFGAFVFSQFHRAERVCADILANLPGGWRGGA